MDAINSAGDARVSRASLQVVIGRTPLCKVGSNLEVSAPSSDIGANSGYFPMSYSTQDSMHPLIRTVDLSISQRNRADFHVLVEHLATAAWVGRVHGKAQVTNLTSFVVSN